MCINGNNSIDGKEMERKGDQWTRLHTSDQPKIDIIRLIEK
jgi:hypothetical protein